MDTALLGTFLAVARLESFTAAAAELHLVQSTVTSRVQALERQLGVRLLDRLPDGARLTEAGERVVERAHQVLDAERMLVEAARDGDPAGDVVLGAPESVCAYRLPAVVAEIRRSLPAVTLHLVASGTDETFRGLLDRRLDLGLVLDERRPAAPLEWRRIGEEPVDVVAPPGSDDRSSWAALAQAPLYLLEEGCSYSDAFLETLSAETGAAASATRFGSIEAARACVEAGLGLSVLPRPATEQRAGAGAVVRLAEPRLPAVPLLLVHDTRRWRSSAVAAVVEVLQGAAASWQ